jgi:hypothetical protein
MLRSIDAPCPGRGAAIRPRIGFRPDDLARLALRLGAALHAGLLGSSRSTLALAIALALGKRRHAECQCGRTGRQ